MFLSTSKPYRTSVSLTIEDLVKVRHSIERKSTKVGKVYWVEELAKRRIEDMGSVGGRRRVLRNQRAGRTGGQNTILMYAATPETLTPQSGGCQCPCTGRRGSRGRPTAGWWVAGTASGSSCLWLTVCTLWRRYRGRSAKPQGQPWAPGERCSLIWGVNKHVAFGNVPHWWRRSLTHPYARTHPECVTLLVGVDDDGQALSRGDGNLMN